MYSKLGQIFVQLLGYILDCLFWLKVPSNVLTCSRIILFHDLNGRQNSKTLKIDMRGEFMISQKMFFFVRMQINGEVLDAIEEDDLLSDFGSSVETSILWQQILKLQTGPIKMTTPHKRKKANSPYSSHSKFKQN